MSTAVMTERIAEASPQFKARIAGLGWLTFLSPPLGRPLFPCTMVAGLVGEGALTLWLLVIGVNAERWKDQARLIGR